MDGNKGQLANYCYGAHLPVEPLIPNPLDMAGLQRPRQSCGLQLQKKVHHALGKERVAKVRKLKLSLTDA